MAHLVYIFSAAGGALGFFIWTAVRAVVMIKGAFTKDPQLSRQSAEMLRLTRKDAKELPSYLPEAAQPPATAGATAPPLRRRHRHRRSRPGPTSTSS